jgi:predicted CXXCH cytochrome family protein
VRPLCVTCHQGIGEQLATEVVHPPAEGDDGCILCHGPHLTGHDKLLLAPVAETCLDCHDGGSADFAAKHLGFPADTIDCGECHDPHASQMAGMLLPEVHMPFAEGDCTTCHQERAESQGGVQ